MLLPLPALALSTQLFSTVADRVPEFDVDPTCRSPARLEASINKDGDACIAGERRARDELARNWAKFRPADQSRCTGLVQMGGPPSYIELLTCLEMARDARDLRNKGADTNTGTR
jgi:hypothetical protein